MKRGEWRNRWENSRHTSMGFCVFRLQRTTILGTLLSIERRSLRNVPKKGTTLHVGISNARLTASQYWGVFSLELKASVRNLKPGISSVIVNQSGRNASILRREKYIHSTILFIGNWCAFSANETSLTAQCLRSEIGRALTSILLVFAWHYWNCPCTSRW